MKLSDRLIAIRKAKVGDKWQHRTKKFHVILTKATHQGKNPQIQYERPDSREFARSETRFAVDFEPMTKKQ